MPALAYLSIAMVILFVVGFATGPGSIPWFFVTELFNQSGRPMATSIAVVTNWSANFLVGLGFSPLQVAHLFKFLCLTFIFIYKWAIHGLFFIYFRLFIQILQILQQINVKKCPSSVGMVLGFKPTTFGT